MDILRASVNSYKAGVESTVFCMPPLVRLRHHALSVPRPTLFLFIGFPRGNRGDAAGSKAGGFIRVPLPRKSV